MEHRTYIRAVPASDVNRVARFCVANPGPGKPARNFSRLAAAQTLLEARLEGQLAGVVGLDLTDRSMAGPWVGAGVGQAVLARQLLVAAERLAARYGMAQLTVYPAEQSADFYADNGYWKVAGERGGRPGLARSIVRRATRFGRRVREISASLGIPSDYGARHQLPLQPEATRLTSIGKDVFGREQKMAPNAASAWRRMVSEAASDGVAFEPVSAFRTVDYQAELIRRKLQKGQSLEQILSVSAAPGYSEHHSGRAIDITAPGFEVLEEPFEGSPAFDWLMANAERFGFSLSYPRDNPHGVAYEPWHWLHK